MKLLFVLGVLVAVSYGREGFGPGEQDWDFVTVRPGAHMFWWLFGTTANVSNITERPLFVWLQGGPGWSSSGFGNFFEIGLLDVNLKPKNYSWVHDTNILFIDNPVGTGFSYVENGTLLSKNNQEIAQDLIVALFGFYEKQPQFRHVPLHICGESYGGKMAVEFVYELNKINKNNLNPINLAGITMVDSWISPIDSVLTWAPYLYNIGAIDLRGFNRISQLANETKNAVDEKKYAKASEFWSLTENLIQKISENVDFYNVLNKIKSEPGENTQRQEAEALNAIMNGNVKNKLNLNATFQERSLDVFMALFEDFMLPVTQLVERILNETDVKVNVVTGQLDLIVDTPGTMNWIERLQWKNSKNWKNVDRLAFAIDGINEGYRKRFGQFSVYWVNRAGHMVSVDNPVAMGGILRDIMKEHV